MQYKICLTILNIFFKLWSCWFKIKLVQLLFTGWWAKNVLLEARFKSKRSWKDGKLKNWVSPGRYWVSKYKIQLLHGISSGLSIIYKMETETPILVWKCLSINSEGTCNHIATYKRGKSTHCTPETYTIKIKFLKTLQIYQFIGNIGDIGRMVSDIMGIQSAKYRMWESPQENKPVSSKSKLQRQKIN